MTVTSTGFRQLASLSTRDLASIMTRGETPSIQNIVGWEYCGYSLPWITSVLGIQRFIKGFFVTATGEAYGCNTPVARGGVGEPWTALPSDDRPRRFAFFRVAPVEPGSRDNRYPQAILLDYAAAPNPRLHPANLLRDYLVRVEPGNDDLLLGRAYFAVGPARLLPGFFLLEHRRPLPDEIHLPR